MAHDHLLLSASSLGKSYQKRHVVLIDDFIVMPAATWVNKKVEEKDGTLTYSHPNSHRRSPPQGEHVQGGGVRADRSCGCQRRAVPLGRATARSAGRGDDHLRGELRSEVEVPRNHSSAAVNAPDARAWRVGRRRKKKRDGKALEGRAWQDAAWRVVSHWPHRREGTGRTGVRPDAVKS